MKSNTKKLNQKGFSAVEALIILVILVAIVAVGWLVWHRNHTHTSTSNPPAAKSTPKTQAAAPKPPTSEHWTSTGKMVLANTTSTDTHKLSNGTYRMYYMSQGQIVYADSSDAVTFGAPSPTGITQDAGMMLSNPSVLKIKSGDWIMIYEEQLQNDPGAGKPGHMGPQRNLYLATSTDGTHFTKSGLAIDSSKSDGYFASVPNLVLLPNGKVRLYYVCGGQAICARVSSDNGKTWTKENMKLNQVAGDPDVLYQNGTWVMYYTKLLPQDNGIYKAYSTDGLNWTPLSGRVIKKANSNVVNVDPDVVQTSANHYTMFYGEAPDPASPLSLYSATYAGNIF